MTETNIDTAQENPGPPNAEFADNPDKQNEIITKIEYSAELTEGSRWCLLNIDWWNQWCAYSNHKQKQGLTYTAARGHDGDNTNPGPIDNNSLVTNIEPNFGYSATQVVFSDPNGLSLEEAIPMRLNSRYLQGFHFLWISEASWNHLHTWFGGGPKIQRQCISDSKGTKTIEENPLTLRVFQLFDDEEEDDDFSSKYFYITASKGDSLEYLFTQMAQQLGLDINSAKKVAGISADSSSSTTSSTSDPGDGIKTIGNNSTSLTLLEELNSGDTSTSSSNPPLEPEEESDHSLDDSNSTDTDTATTDSDSASTTASDDKKDPKSAPHWRKTVPWRVWRMASNIHIEKLSVTKEWNEKLSNCQLHDRSGLCIEFQDKDGSWPRGGGSQSSSAASSTFSSVSRPRSRITSSLNSSYNSNYYYGNSYSKPSPPGLCGLSNLGNTCFMNSGLQCLSNSTELVNHFTSGNWKADLNPSNPLGMKGLVATAFGNLMKNMWSGTNSVVTPSEFKATIGQFASQFMGYSQHDSQELLSFLLDGLHEDLNRVKKKPATHKVEDTTGEIPDTELAEESWDVYLQRNQSIIVDLFQGQYKSRLECPTEGCDHISITFDPFMYLSLPIPGKRFQNIEFTLIPHWDEKTIPKDPQDQFPVTYTIPMKKGANFGALSQILGEKTGRTSQEFAITSITGSTITKQFKVEDIIPDTTYSNIRFFVFDENSINLIVTARHKIKSYYWTYSQPTFKKIGEPFLLHLSKQPGESRFRSVYDQLFYQVQYYLKPDWREIIDQNYPPKGKGATTDTPLPESTGNGNETKSEASKSTESNDSDELDQDLETGDSLDTDNSGDAISRGGVGSQLPKPNSYFQKPNSDDDDSDEDEFYHSAPTKKPFSLKRFPDGTPILFDIKATDNYGHQIEDPEDPFDEETDLLNKWSAEKQIYVDWHTDLFNLIANDDDYSKTVEADETSPKSQGNENVNIYGALNLFCEQEVLSKDDTWYCSKCQQHVQATKKFDLWKVPKLLVIHLKRFRYGSAMYGWRTKIDQYVDFPLEGLDLTKFVQGPQNANPLLYDCYAVSQHYGFGGGGHYTACGTNTNGKWYNFDDSRVSEIQPSEAKTSAAYVLFYRLRDSTSDIGSDSIKE